MRLLDLLSLATRMFKTRPLRTFLTILGVGVGIGTVLFLVSLGYGLQGVILERIATADSLLTLDVSPGPSDALTLTDGTVTEIERLPQVAGVSRSKTFSAQLTVQGLTGNGQVVAIDHSFLRLKGDKAQAGRLPNADAPQESLLTSAAVQLLNQTPEEILGDTMEVTLFLPGSTPEAIEAIARPTLYTIVGIVEDENTSAAYVTLPSLSDLQITSYDQLKVKAEASGAMEGVRAALIERGFVVAALSDTIEQASNVFRIVQIVLALFGLVALLVSAIGMFNTMTITLLERTNEIGIMRAIGVTRRDVRRMFLVESMLMGFLGGLGGVILGIAAGEVANVGLNLVAVKFGGTAIDLFSAPTWFILFILVFSTVIGFVTGIYPSYKASSLNPLDALRYK